MMDVSCGCLSVVWCRFLLGRSSLVGSVVGIWSYGFVWDELRRIASFRRLKRVELKTS